MLKSFDEMRQIDIAPYVEQRDGFDYLNWAKCIDLLHQNGASEVWFEPVIGSNGSSLFMSDKYFGAEGKGNQCYEVRVRIHIDDKEWEAQGPLMNGSNPVRDNSMTQQRVWTGQTRLFVKSVAVHTGLGFNLWLKDSEIENTEDDIYRHNIFAIKERVQQKYTRLIKKGLSTKDIAEKINTTEDVIKWLFTAYDQLANFEKDLDRL